MLSAMLLNTFLERYGATALQGAGNAWMIAVFSMTACRMVLNIRDMAAPPRMQSSVTASTSLGTELQVLRVEPEGSASIPPSGQLSSHQVHFPETVATNSYYK
ncbi:hypothetical protein K439DRAFT_1147771 [Ramaria rubella]|nr:hypothetical protein K439DRAFT_1147771 [Ramaria rubella]